MRLSHCFAVTSHVAGVIAACDLVITMRTTLASAVPSQVTPSKDTDFQQALGILKQAARSKSVPGHLVVEAMLKLGKQNLAVSSPDVICLVAFDIDSFAIRVFANAL